MKAIQNLCIQLWHNGKTHEVADLDQEEAHSCYRGRFHFKKKRRSMNFPLCTNGSEGILFYFWASMTCDIPKALHTSNKGAMLKALF